MCFSIIILQYGPNFGEDERVEGNNSESNFGFDLENIDMQVAYNLMYEAIIEGNGVKPQDTFYLNWVLQRNSEIFGYGHGALNKTIKIGKELM